MQAAESLFGFGLSRLNFYQRVQSTSWYPWLRRGGQKSNLMAPYTRSVKVLAIISRTMTGGALPRSLTQALSNYSLIGPINSTLKLPLAPRGLQDYQYAYLYSCLCKLRVLFLGVLITRALLLGVPLIFGNTHIYIYTYTPGILSLAYPVGQNL